MDFLSLWNGRLSYCVERPCDAFHHPLWRLLGAVQVNGKIRARITVPPDAEEEQIREITLADEKVKAAIAGKEIVKVLVVKGRLVNIVVK